MMAIKRFFLTALFSLCAIALPALDLTDVHHTLGGAFYGFIDPNEGLSSFLSLNIPCGGREESLGGAFIGLADDIGFLTTTRPAPAFCPRGNSRSYTTPG